MTVSTASCWQKKKRLPTARRTSSRSWLTKSFFSAADAERSSKSCASLPTTPALDQFRAAAGQEFVVPVRLAEGVADDDPIDDVGHVESPRHPAAASVTDSGSSTFFDASRISNRTIPPSYPKSAMTPGRTSSLSLIRSSRREITRVSVSRSY